MRATLTRDLFYIKDNNKIHLRRGDVILVDPNNCIALVNEVDHMAILPEDYTVLLPN